MNVELLPAYFAIVVLAVLSPGPAILLAIRNVLRYGMGSAIWSSLGNILGLMMLSVAALLGVGAILQSSLWVFMAVKIVGALYLIFLGLRQLRSRGSVWLNAEDTGCVEALKTPSRFKLMTEAFLMAVTNPKPILFFTALFPQFLSLSQPLLPQFAGLTAILMAMSFFALMGYALLVSRSRDFLQQPIFSRWMNRVIGSAFVALGLSLLLIKRPSIV